MQRDAASMPPLRDNHTNGHDRLSSCIRKRTTIMPPQPPSSDTIRKWEVSGPTGTAAELLRILAMASDLRLGTARSKVAFLFVKVGLSGSRM